MFAPNDSWGLIDVNKLYGGCMQVDTHDDLLVVDVQSLKRGMLFVVYDDDSATPGLQTKMYMFLPAEGTWSYNSPFEIPATNQNQTISSANLTSYLVPVNLGSVTNPDPIDKKDVYYSIATNEFFRFDEGTATWIKITPASSNSDVVASNAAITGATNTKITYDAKGLVTAGAAATTADIAASADKNYVTDAKLAVLNNTSGTNTGDQDLSALATTAATTVALNLKVDKEAGKGLSTNDYTTAEQTKLAAISGTNTGDQDLRALATTAATVAALNLKVDKETGKGLSTNDYTTAEQTKLAAISGTNTGDQDLSALATTAATTTALNLKVDKEAGKGLSTNDYTTDEQIKLAAITGTNTGDQILPTLSSLGAVAGNGAITAGTNTKITYDAKGLVTGGAAATTADIAVSANKNYVTDAKLAVLNNTSGINTGDQDLTGLNHTNRAALDAVSGINTGDQVLPTLSSLGAVAGNTAITAGTKTKITFDAKGLVTAGAAATTADIAASPDKNYVSDAKLAVLNNTSGINTGDQNAAGISIADAGNIIAATNVEDALQENRIAIDLNTAKVTNATHTGEVTGSVALTIDNDAVIAKKLTGFTSGAGTIVATDNILQAIQKLAGNVSEGGMNFNIDRPITLSGTNATGQNLGSGGKTMAEFFEAFFFPAVAASPPTSTFTTATTTFPYSTWKNWSSYTGNLSFSWSVTNVSQSDNTDDKLITSIKLKSGATQLATVPSPTGTNQSGTFSSIPLQNTNGNVTTDFTKTYTLEVVDAQPNTVNKNIVVTMNKAIRLTYGAPSLTPSTTVYEFDVNNKAITLGWSITPNDETITNISVDGTSTGSTAATGTQAVTFKTVANGGSLTKAFPLVVTGDLYGAGSAQNSATVSWDNRLYRGVVTSATPPCDGGFAFTDNEIKALSTETKLGGNWKAAAGFDFVCGAGGQYIVFAYPDDNLTPVVQYYDSNFNSWMTYPASDLKIINRANFLNQNGYSGTNYKVVFICVQYFSATLKIRLQ